MEIWDEFMVPRGECFDAGVSVSNELLTPRQERMLEHQTYSSLSAVDGHVDN